MVSIFSKNKRYWLSELGEKGISQYKAEIIKNFFLNDNISYKLYRENHRANEIVKSLGSYDFYEVMSSESHQYPDRPNPTKSFYRYFSSMHQRPIGYDDWFLIAYPDVAHYFSANYDSIRDELDTREEELFGSKKELTPQFYRFIINRYKSLYKKLECVDS